MEKSTTGTFLELERCYGQLVSWCDLLEAIADFLPCQVDQRLWDMITNGLVPLLLFSHKLEQDILSTGLELIMTRDEFIAAKERRRTSRLLDYDAAEELVETLGSLKEGRCQLSWDAVGFQLRAFFGSLRRHIRSEREVLKLIQKAMKGQASLLNSVGEPEAA